MSAQAPPVPGAPWYRQFWPWFVLGLLGTSIVGSLTTVFIAVSGADPEVRRDHQAASKAARPGELPADRALALGVGAMIGVEADGTRMSLEGWVSSGELPDRLAVHFAHPTLVERDVRLVAVREADGVHRAPLSTPLEGRYEIAISPAVVSSAASDSSEAPTDREAEWVVVSRATLAPGAWIVVGAPRAGPRPGAS